MGSIVAARKVPESAKNSALVLRKVSELSPPEWLARNGGKWELPLPAVAANLRLPNNAIAQARQALGQARPAVELALTLRDCGSGHTPIELAPDVVSTRIPHVDFARHGQSLLQWETVLALEDRDTDRATAAVTAMLNTSRSIGDDPFMICQLVRISTRAIANRSLERVLAQATPSDGTLERLATRWAADVEENLLLGAYRGERAMMDLMMSNLLDGTSRTTGPESRFSRFAWWVHRTRFWKDRVYLHRYYSQAVEIARLPLHEQAAAMGTLPPLPDPEMKMAGLFVPAVEKCAAAFARSVAEGRCVVVGIACERFRIRNGRWPETLAELCPEFLATVPLDPFDGQPLRVAKQNNGLVIHSTGRNPQTAVNGAQRPGLPEGIDIGFRLWNPEARRQLGPPKQPDRMEKEIP